MKRLLTPLSMLRLARPGAPTAREVARRIGISHNAVAMFEAGTQGLSDENLRKYAKIVRQPVAHVRRRFMLAKLEYFEVRTRELRAELRAMGITLRRGATSRLVG